MHMIRWEPVYVDTSFSHVSQHHKGGALTHVHWKSPPTELRQWKFQFATFCVKVKRSWSCKYPLDTVQCTWYLSANWVTWWLINDHCQNYQYTRLKYAWTIGIATTYQVMFLLFFSKCTSFIPTSEVYLVNSCHFCSSAFNCIWALVFCVSCYSSLIRAHF